MLCYMQLASMEGADLLHIWGEIDMDAGFTDGWVLLRRMSMSREDGPAVAGHVERFNTRVGQQSRCSESCAPTLPEDEDHWPVDDGSLASHALSTVQNAHCCTDKKGDDQSLLCHARVTCLCCVEGMSKGRRLQSLAHRRV